jgi:hypothetical protein
MHTAHATRAHASTHRMATDTEYLDMHGVQAQAECSYLRRTYAQYYGASISSCGFETRADSETTWS